ncbi:apoptosis inducing factor family protein [Paraburkholderia caledonica]|uniref:apoptosis inducing factor family protein n=1 Tax=Paraburkholderia caledonica TaxID=134536 RepID=UPI0003A2B483|nr:apoptosis inducing factor family protein [Paraburkholderia caledonica]
MTETTSTQAGPDFTQGISSTEIQEGRMLTGNVGGKAALLIRHAGELFAIGATCTHYGAPLAEGLLVDDTIRCPWHHACFSLRNGQMLRPPALSGIKCWHVEERDGRAVVGDEMSAPRPPKLATTGPAGPVVIIGGGAAGTTAAVTLQREGYEGLVIMLSADHSSPYDRPSLSKDYLSGAGQAAWLPLKSPQYYADHRIEIRCDTHVVSLNVAERSVTLSDGSRLSYGALLLATGAEPNRLCVPGADLSHVHLLRTRADCDALIANIKIAHRCVVVGAGFIGLEAAASLRERGLDVWLVTPGTQPMEHALGTALGDMIKVLHEAHGVVFHLGATVAKIEPDSVILSTGEVLAADLVLVGIGVHPNTSLWEEAGIATDCGVVVDGFLRTNAADVYAAGDIARWPDPRTGYNIRVEHWVVAERQGVIAARNILGKGERFAAVPFFWTLQYNVGIHYVGHAEHWDRVEVDGDPLKHDCTVTFWRGDKRLAVANVGRELESLQAELAFEEETSE